MESKEQEQKQERKTIKESVISKVIKAINKAESSSRPLSPYELFGFEIGLGWYGLLLPVLQAISVYNIENPDDETYVEQVKEKWGQLCIYVSSATEEIFNLIEIAEEESAYICETCGARGSIRDINGWYKTLCDRHFYGPKKK